MNASMNSSKRMPIAKLVPPHADKHWSFQVANREPAHEQAVRVCMASADVKAAKPFLQGCSVDWLMVEFWTHDIDDVARAANALAESVGLPLQHGNFTRGELGLD